ncbi:hypothetical protein PVIIG_05640 [Plasmodium vivax India VII]|uniref:VIR protein n=1 Tax=Plasmodium vivax India VII TaxID=1077284 RepID=A0A0J9S332_PLAVI|nr:hypothetical protein PVIIG_05640 [Plasmodium vivax India VII]
MANVLGDDRLRLLRTKYNYKNFDEESGTCEGVNFYAAAKKELSSYGGFPKISDKIFKAVCYVYNESKTGKIDDDMCNSLYFWMGNTLINSLSRTEFYSEVIIKLFNRLNENKVGKICKIPHIRMDESDFKKIKLIFDYFQDYDNYNMDLALYNRPCNEEYNKYLTTYVKNYKQLYNECFKEHKRHNYCQEFEKYYDNEKHHNLFTWSCKLTLTLPKDDPSKGEPQNEEQKAELGVSSGRGGVQQPLQERNETVQAYEQFPGLLNPNPVMPQESRVSSTSDGNMINKLLGRTTRMNPNPLMEAQLINNFYQPEGFNSERSGYNISYRPV